jgi:predicted Zn-dependent peptidase
MSEPRQTQPHTRHIQLDSEQAYVVVGYRAPSVSQFKEACALDVALAALGDTYGGRLSTALAGKRIKVTKIAVDFITQRDPGLFSVLLTADPADAGRAGQAALDEMRRLGSKGLTSAELAQAKRLIEGSDMFEQETFSGQARALGLYEAIASYDLALSYAKTIRSMTQADVVRAARKYLSGEGYTLVTLGPEPAGAKS